MTEVGESPNVRFVGPTLAVLGLGPAPEVVAALADALTDQNVLTVVGAVPRDWPAALDAIMAALVEPRPVRLAVSGAGDGAPTPAAALATALSFPVQCSAGPVLTLPGGRLFAPRGWYWFAPGCPGPTAPNGRRHPAPPWELSLDRFATVTPAPGLRVLPSPAGLWITRADGAAPRLDDPVLGAPTDHDTALVIVGGSSGDQPDPLTVTELLAHLDDVPLRVVSYGSEATGRAPDPSWPSPWWVANGLVHELAVGFDPTGSRFVADGTSLTPGELGEHIAADPRWLGRPVLLRCAAAVPDSSVQALADQLHAPVVMRTEHGGWRAHHVRDIERGSPLPIELSDIDTVDDVVGLVATTPDGWTPPPTPPVRIDPLPGPAIEVNHTDGPAGPFAIGDLSLSTWELALAVWPSTDGATELRVHAGQATDDQLRLLAGYLRLTVVTPDGSRFAPRGRPIERASPKPVTGGCVAGPVVPTDRVDPSESIGPVLTPRPEPGRTRPTAPYRPAGSPRSVPGVPRTVPPVAPPVVLSTFAEVASTPEQHQVLRQVLDWRYDVYLRQVTRALAQRPGMRADTVNPDGVVPDLVAVTALLNNDDAGFLDALRRQPRDEESEALLACFRGGLRRLPRQLGLTYAAAGTDGEDADLFRGAMFAGGGFLTGSTTAPELSADDVELVIWSTTGRRVGGFTGDDTRSLVLFPPQTRLVVLDAEGDTARKRVFLTEYASSPLGAAQHERVLSRLRSAPAATRSPPSRLGADPSPATVTVARPAGSPARDRRVPRSRPFERSADHMKNPA